jgi:hypothetical protein
MPNVGVEVIKSLLKGQYKSRHHAYPRLDLFGERSYLEGQGTDRVDERHDAARLCTLTEAAPVPYSYARQDISARLIPTAGAFAVNRG